MTRLVRTAAAAPVLVAALFTANGVAPLVPGAAICAAAGYTSRLALVVEHSDGRAIRLCIGFDGASLTGEQILKASGLEYATASYGSLGDAVCQIDSEPATYPPSCWTNSSPYWVMFVSRQGAPWSGADHGVSSETFADGDAEGFRYDPQSGPAHTPPLPGGVCATASQSSGGTQATAASSAPRATHGVVAAGGTPRPTAGTAPTAAVIAVVTPAPHATARVATATHPVATPSGVSVALLLASAGLGALMGLAGVRLIRRRRA